jgi:hypothetical protein
MVRKMAVQIATEKSRSNTTVTVPVHPEFSESLRAARAAGILGVESPHRQDGERPRAADEEGMGD